MNELEELKARAASYPHLHDTLGASKCSLCDLNRAIAIAEKAESGKRALAEVVARKMTERDKAIAAGLALRDAFGRVLDAGLNNETLFDTMAAGRRVLAEHAWLEEHR